MGKRKIEDVNNLNKDPATGWKAMNKTKGGFTGHFTKPKEMVNMKALDGSIAQNDEESASSRKKYSLENRIRPNLNRYYATETDDRRTWGTTKPSYRLRTHRSTLPKL
jgi:hypothetical protein